MRAQRGRLWSAIAWIGVLVVVAACGTAANSQPTASRGEPTSAASGTSAGTTAGPATSPSAPAAAIVGEWVGTHDCERILAILQGAGLDEFLADAINGNQLVPGASPEAALGDPARPCAGAIPRAHSHVFTADGRFASRDFNGQEVDSGTYVIQGGDTVVINKVPFGFRVVGDELTLVPKPVDVSACTTKECRFAATWVLMVAMPGTSWTRGTIPG